MLRSAVLALALIACGDNAAAPPDGSDVSNDAAPDGFLGGIDALCTGQPSGPRVLVYTFENVWRHLSNYYARLAIYDMCVTRGFNVTITNDPLAINATRLADADVVVFSLTSGNGITAEGQAALEAFVHRGGGIVGLHSGRTPSGKTRSSCRTSARSSRATTRACSPRR